MGLFNRLILRVKRSDSPFTKFLKRLLKLFYRPAVPPLPRVLLPGLRLLYELHFLTIATFRWLLTVAYRNPLFQSRCASFGRRVSVAGLPFVSGHVEIHVGDDVAFGGGITILSGGTFEQARLVLKDRSELGWNCMVVVNREVVLEEDVRVSWGCRISDSDGHPREADRRAAGEPPDAKDALPVRICRHAWIGNGSYIMKGVTIGEGAIIGVNSVVIGNIPPYSLAMGNPAEVILRNYGLPTTARKTRSAEPPSQPPNQAAE